MTGLKNLHLYGSPTFLRTLVSHLPQISPHLQGFTIKSVSHTPFTYHIHCLTAIPTDIMHMTVKRTSLVYQLLGAIWNNYACILLQEIFQRTSTVFNNLGKRYADYEWPIARASCLSSYQLLGT